MIEGVGPEDEDKGGAGILQEEVVDACARLARDCGIYDDEEDEE